MATRNTIVTTGTQATEGRAQRDVSPIIHQLEPNKYPLVVLLTKAEGRLTDADNYKVESFEDELLPKFSTLAAELAADAVEMTVANGTYFVKNMLVRVNRGEIVRVTATPAANVVAITRAVGETAAALAANGSQLHIIGTAFEEASDTGVILGTVKTNPFNYLQIFKNTVGWSNSAKAYKVYGEADKAYDRAKAIVEHAKDIELSVLLGERSTGTGPDGNRLSTMRGVFKYIATNNIDAGGAFTEAEMEEVMRIAFRYGSDKKVGILSSKLVSVINGFGRDKLQTVSSEASYGISMSNYKNAGYNLDLVRHPLLENASLTDLAGLQGMGMILDINDLEMKKAPGRYMVHNYDLQTKGYDLEKEDILSECAVLLNSEKKHAKVFGVTS
jgi:hypothetical protein